MSLIWHKITVMVYDSALFSKTIKLKRLIELEIPIRKAATVICISSSTLCRIENGQIPDLLTYAKLCKWLKKDMNVFIKNRK